MLRLVNKMIFTLVHGICFAGDANLFVSKCDDLARFIGRSIIAPMAVGCHSLDVDLTAHHTSKSKSSTLKYRICADVVRILSENNCCLLLEEERRFYEAARLHMRGCLPRQNMPRIDHER